MESTANNNQPSSGIAHHNPFTSAEAIGFWSIIFGLALPPLGLVLAAAAIYRAGRLAKKTAMILGVLGLAAVIAGSIFYTWVYREHRKTTVNNTYNYSSYDTYSLSGLGKGTGMSFVKPSSFVSQGSLYGSNVSISFGQTADIAAFSTPIAVGSVDANIVLPSIKIDSTYLKGLKTTFTSGLTSTRYQNFKTATINWLSINVVPRAVITLGSPQAFTNANIKANAWSFNYSATGTYPDGTARNIKGTLIFAVGSKDYYYLSVASTASNWNANTTVWQKVIGSLKINQ